MTTQNNNINHLFKNMTETLKRRAFVAAAALVLCAGAAQRPNRAITLDEAIKLGQQNSKVLRLSKAKIDEAVSEYEQAKDQGLPSGKASFGYDRAEIPANSLEFGKSDVELPTRADAY